MRLFGITDSVEGEFWGPYTDEVLANKVLGIVRKAVDDEAEIVTAESDPHAAELRAGLLPWKIGIEIFPSTGEVRDTKVELAWPPHPEGLVSQMETYVEHFVWAKSKGEAITKMARLSRTGPDRSSSAPAPDEPRDFWSDRRQGTRPPKADGEASFMRSPAGSLF